jgi:hypothetical protein
MLQASMADPDDDDEEDLISFDDVPMDPLVKWVQQILPNWQAKRLTAKVRRDVLEGAVPPSVVGSLWCSALGSTSNDEAAFEASQAAATKLRERLEFDWDGALRRADPQLDDLAVISADVPRTSPEHQRDGSLDASTLQGVLDAYVASSRPSPDFIPEASHDGYSQGMADVAAWMLRNQLSPRQCYGCLHALSRQPLLRAVMGLDQACWGAVCAVFEAHLGRGAPALHAHLGALGLQPFFFLPEWLVALWCRSLRDECCTLAWNYFMVEGERFLIASALGVTLALGPLLMQCPDLPSCRDVLSNGPRGMSVSSFRDAATHLVEPALLQPLAPWMTLGPDSYGNASLGPNGSGGAPPTSTRRKSAEAEPPRPRAQVEL